MGRGGAKAKQQKVARELKYNSSHFTDLDALRRELGAEPPSGSDADQPTWDDADEGDEEDDWVSATR